MLVTQMFSFQLNTNFIILGTIRLSAANAFNIDESAFLSPGQELNSHVNNGYFTFSVESMVGSTSQLASKKALECSI